MNRIRWASLYTRGQTGISIEYISSRNSIDKLTIHDPTTLSFDFNITKNGVICLHRRKFPAEFNKIWVAWYWYGDLYCNDDGDEVILMNN